MNTKTTVISEAQLNNQFAFCDKIAAYWHDRDRTPKAYVETYGCQQNEADSEKLRGYLLQCGYTIANEAEGADVVILNTCAIDRNPDFAFYRDGMSEHIIDVLVAVEKEIARITKELEGQQKFLAGLEAKLSNEKFVSRAPEAVVAAEREKAAKHRDLIAQLEQSLEAMQKLA